MVVPADTPVTVPVVPLPLMVATPVLEDVHGLLAAAVPEPVKVVVPVLQMLKVPDIVGSALTVTVAVC